MRISGTVIEGKKRGRTLGFPTLNMRVTEQIASGVYCGSVQLGEHLYHAALFKSADEPILEAHLIDFHDDAYGKDIVVTLGKKLRDVQRFANDEELKQRIAQDVRLCSRES